MQSEINMHQSQVKEFKYEIELLSRELQDVRKKYFMQKKKEQQQRSVQAVTTSCSYKSFCNLNDKISTRN